MLEAKYYRDYKHNYMILQCEKREMQGSYQYKILTSGKIDEILRCTMRYINGMAYYYYDISSRTTLENLYRGKKMTYEQVKDLFLQLHGICDRLSGYFMDEAGLVLLPEHIYYDLSARKYIGLFYPGYHAAEAGACIPLMDFLLEHIDTENQQLTEDLYNICEIAEAPGFSIEDALQILEDEERPEPEQEPQPQLQAHELEMEKSEVFPLEEELYAPREEEGRPKKQERAKSGVFYLLFAALSALGIAGAAVVHSLYELTGEEETALYGAAAALCLCLVVSLAGARKSRGKQDAKKGGAAKTVAEEQAEELYRTVSGEYFPAEEAVPLGRVISRDMDLTAASRGYESYPPVKPDAAQEDGCGNTVFFDSGRLQEYKLYAVDKKNKKHIELKQFPCTVGKMAGCVDYVLSDASVSRIHARFDRQGERLFLTDMNSTNGTYKNGLRMQPQETVEIEPGDEVRFGSLNYCYR